MRVHVPMRGECPDHLTDLNFSFDHNFLIRRFRGALRRYLIEDSFVFVFFKMSALYVFLRYSYYFANFSLDIFIKSILIKKSVVVK